MANDGTVKIGTELDQSGLKSGLSGAASSLGSLASSGFKVLTGAVAATATAVAGLGAMAVKAGAEFETSMTKASTLFGDVAVDTDNLNAKILEISSSTGVAAAEMGEALYSALSAGIPVSEDMSEATMVLEKSAQLAKAGFTDVDTALAATAKTMNAYGMGVEAVDDIQKVLIQTQNLGITTVDELGASLAQVTPTAAAFGVSFDQIGAALAGMTAAGTPTAQATTQLNSLIAELGKSGTIAANNLMEAAEGTQYAGMSFNEMMDSGATLQDVLDMLGAKAEESGLSMVDMFSSIEAGKAALAIDGSDFAGNLEAMSTEADVVGEAYNTMSNTLESGVDRIKTSLTNLGISMYEQVGGPLADITSGAAGMIEQLQAAFNEGGFTGLAETAGSVVAEIATNIAAQAPTLINTAFTIIQSFLQGINDNLPAIMEGAISTIEAFVTGIMNMLPQIAQMAVSIVSQLAQTFLENLPTIIETGVQLLANLMNGIASMLPDFISMAVDMIISFAENLINNLPTIIEAGLNMIVALVEGLAENMPRLLEKAPEMIANLVVAIVKALPQLLEAALKIMLSLGKYMIQSISSLLTIIPDIFKRLKESFQSLNWGEIGSNLIDGIKEGVSNAAHKLIEGVVEVAKKAIDGVKDFLGIHSPSTLARDVIGKNLIAGIGVGIEDQTPDLVSTAQESMNTLVDGIQASVYSTSRMIAPELPTPETGPEPTPTNAPVTNNYNFYQPVETPDETARAIKKVNTFGLAGA